MHGMALPGNLSHLKVMGWMAGIWFAVGFVLLKKSQISVPFAWWDGTSKCACKNGKNAQLFRHGNDLGLSLLVVLFYWVSPTNQQMLQGPIKFNFFFVCQSN